MSYWMTHFDHLRKNQFSSRLRKPIYEKTADEYRRDGKDELIGMLTQKVMTDYGSEIELADDLQQAWEPWEYKSGLVRTKIEGTTFFYTTLTDLVRYIGSSRKQWVNDDHENWLIVITGNVENAARNNFSFL